MKKDIFLIHWNADEAKAEAAMLQDLGWNITISSEDTEEFTSDVAKLLPAAVLIYLNRSPSRGSKIGRKLHLTPQTSHIPLIFVNGKKSELETILAMIPAAIFTDNDGVHDILISLSIRR